MQYTLPDPSASVTLTWPGKRAPKPVTPASPVLLETFEPARLPNSQFPSHNSPSFFHGDNLPILSHLLAAGWRDRFRLIYADPPYASGAAWTRKVRLRRQKRHDVEAVAGEQVQYVDVWEEGAYLQFMYDRLPLLRDLLCADGSLWLHCDYRHTHQLRCLLEEVFGPDNYLNTVTWRSQTARGAKVNAFYFPNSAHTLLIFACNRAAPTCWNPPKKSLILSEAEAAAEFMRDERGFFRTSDPGTYAFESLKRLHAEGRLYAPYAGEIVVDEERRNVYTSNGGNIGVKYYLADLGNGRHALERALDNIWDDISGLGTTPLEDLGYPTQKTEALLARIVQTATQPGDWVLDPFMGSGTTQAVAQKLGRRWMGCDAAQGALQTAVRRLQAVMQAQLAAGAAPKPEGFAIFGAGERSQPPASGPQVSLVITRIQGEPARIRIVVDRVEWAEGTPAAGADWRAAIDSIAVDPAYDGRVLRVALADAPLKKTQPVTGSYELPVATHPATVAVRVLDVWGQETLVTRVI